MLYLPIQKGFWAQQFLIATLNLAPIVLNSTTFILHMPQLSYGHFDSSNWCCGSLFFRV